MAEIRAFRASRFSGEAGELGRLLAPASESVSPEERERLATEPNNIVHATIPPADPDDRSKFVRFARASAQLSAWRRGGVLVVDATSSLYRLTQGSCMSLLALVRASDVETAEAAPPRAREDRLRVLEATRTYLEPVPLSVEGAGFVESLREASGVELARAEPGDGSTLVLEAISDGAALAVLPLTIRAIAVSAIAAIDAAVAFRAALGEREGPVAQDFVLAELLPEGDAASSVGLVLWTMGEFA